MQVNLRANKRIVSLTTPKGQILYVDMWSLTNLKKAVELADYKLLYTANTYVLINQNLERVGNSNTLEGFVTLFNQEVNYG